MKKDGDEDGDVLADLAVGGGRLEGAHDGPQVVQPLVMLCGGKVRR